MIPSFAARNAAHAAAHTITSPNVSEHIASASSASNGRSEIIFIRSATAVLFVTGAAKVYSAFWTNANALGAINQIEPLFGFSFRSLFLAAGLIELMIVLVCVATRNNTLRLTLIFGLAVHFLLYRGGLWLLGYKKPCSCLGSLTEALRLDPYLADNVMLTILGVLLLGGGLLLYKRFARNQPISSEKT